MTSKQNNLNSTISINDKYYLKIFIIASIAILAIGGVGIGLYYGLKDSLEESLECISCSDTTKYLGHYCSNSKLGEYQTFAVSTDSEPCAAIGKKILEEGGNAMESIISVLLCMGVTIPESMGLGGGSFIIVFDAKTNTTSAIDARETAPEGAYEDIYNKTGFQNSKDGPLSIAVPGELAGYWHLYQNFKSGNISWSRLFEDSIQLCEKGFNVSQHLSDALSQKQDMIMKYKPLRDIYFNEETNKIYSAGEVLIQKKLGETLRLLADQSDPKTFFYEVLSKQIVKDINDSNHEWNITTEPIISYEDFKNYNIVERLPVNTTFNTANMNLTLHTFPLPGSGNILSFIFNVMQSYSSLYPSAGDSLSDSTLFYHRLVETFKFAFASRMHLGDPAFEVDNCTQVINNLTSTYFMELIKSKINDSNTFNSSSGYYDAEKFLFEDHGTAHVAVVDALGNAVSVTTTVNLYLGSKVMSSSTGILLNDEMDDFNSGQTNDFGIPPSDVNKIEPNKRPLSSMVPSIFTDDNGIRLVIGGSGGPKIITATALVSIRHLLFGEDIKTAIDAPRIHHQLFPDKVVYEKCFPKDILSELQAKGHQTEALGDGDRGAIIMAISRLDGKLYANSDYRKGGTVAGI